MTDSELRQAFREGFANPQHLDKLLKRTDLSPDREISARTNLSQAVNSARIQPEALQRFISQLSKAKTTDQFDQVLAELSHANRLIESGVVAKNSLVFVSAKQGRQYHLGSMTVEIDPVHEADALYLSTAGRIHLHEVKNTAKALRQAVNKHPKQLQRMLRWRKAEPDKREIRIVIASEAGWTQVFAARRNEDSVLEILNESQVPLTIGEVNLTLATMDTLWDATIRKIMRLTKQNSKLNFNEFYRQMSTLAKTEKFLGVSLL